MGNYLSMTIFLVSTLSPALSLLKYHLARAVVEAHRDEIPLVQPERFGVLNDVPREIVPGGDVVAEHIRRPERVSSRILVTGDDVVAPVHPASCPIHPRCFHVGRVCREVFPGAEIVIPVELVRAESIVLPVEIHVGSPRGVAVIPSPE